MLLFQRESENILKIITKNENMKRRQQMVRKGFKMKLYPGMEAEYEKWHNELWPEMQEVFHLD